MEKEATSLILILLEAKAGTSLRVRGQPGLHREFRVSQVYIVRTCLQSGVELSEQQHTIFSSFS